MDIRPTANAAQGASAVFNDKTAPPGAGISATATESASAVRQPEPAPTADQLTQALKSINSVLQVRSQDLEFSVDHESARTIVTVTDKNTGDVIRQMPTKEALEIAKALDHLQSLLIRQTA